MAGALISTGTSRTAGQLSGDANGNAAVTLPAVISQSGYDRNAYEVDAGAIVGTANADLKTPELDSDYRLRVSLDSLLDEENFNYTAQNTGKHSFTNTTMTSTWTAGNYTTNSGSITTTTTGGVLASYAAFPMIGTHTLSCDVEQAFSAQPQTNSFVEWGLGIPGAATVAPTDGVFFRLQSGGLQGVVSFNGTETTSSIFPLSGGTGTWVYTNARKYQFIIYISTTEAVFWVNDMTGGALGALKLGSVPLPAAQGRLAMASGLQFFHKHRITGGAAGGVLQASVGAYNIRSGGALVASSLGETGNRIYGSYQGLSGGTMGGLATYVNSTNPTAAAPSNTALTANLPSGLGGQGAVIAAAAAATDGIWGSYQNPAGTVNVQGRRLKITGVVIDAVNIGAAVATTATTVQFCLAFGHTAVSLATAESATSKAPRRIALGFMSWAVAAAIGDGPARGPIVRDFSNAPIFVNPGEFVQLVGKFLVGTATGSQVIEFTWQPIYGWE